MRGHKKEGRKKEGVKGRGLKGRGVKRRGLKKGRFMQKRVQVGRGSSGGKVSNKEVIRVGGRSQVGLKPKGKKVPKYFSSFFLSYFRRLQ